MRPVPSETGVRICAPPGCAQGPRTGSIVSFELQRDQVRPRPREKPKPRAPEALTRAMDRMRSCPHARRMRNGREQASLSCERFSRHGGIWHVR